MADNLTHFPEQAPRLLCTIAITRFPDGTIKAGFQHMPKPVIEAHGADVAERVTIAAGWILEAAADMEQQAKAWAEALYGEKSDGQ